jgi:hypothetical protein
VFYGRGSGVYLNAPFDQHVGGVFLPPRHVDYTRAYLAYTLANTATNSADKLSYRIS